MTRPSSAVRTKLFDEPEGKFLHDVILASCHSFGEKTALVDTSYSPPLRLSYAEFGERVERIARGLVAAGIRPRDVIGIYLPNCWEFAATFHAVTLAGGIPTLLNPTYREREVRYQLENSESVALITDGVMLENIDLGGLSHLRKVFTTRTPSGRSASLSTLYGTGESSSVPRPEHDPRLTLAALPYSSGTTGLPKGVMLSHYNLVSNVFQMLSPGEAGALRSDEVVLCFLPLYHIYGLTVAFNAVLACGATLVLMPRFDCGQTLRMMVDEGITMIPCVPPVLLAYCVAAESGLFPKQHRLRWVKCGAAPLSPELARRFIDLTGVPIRQGYGMTEASPVTHMGFLEPELYKPESIGMPLARTECRIVDDSGNEVPRGEPGELLIRGPQIMLGYWKAPEATEAVLHDGWYWTGDVVRVDEAGLYYVVDRRKELIKYKGFSVAPAELEGVLLEHEAVRDCGVVSRKDQEAGEVPCAFVVLREGFVEDRNTEQSLMDYLGERLTYYKMPREIRFVTAIPRTASGKILRRKLREMLTM